MNNKKKYFLIFQGLFYFLLLNIILISAPNLTQGQIIDFYCIDINTASKEELEDIAGIGPVLAQRITDARPFFSIDELIKVSGIAEIKLANIKEQNLACVQGQIGVQEQTQIQTQEQIPQEPEQTKPIITLSYSQENPVNKEIEITFLISNLKKSDYDLKISIEKEEENLSDIYNEKENKWQSSHYYLNNIFFGISFEKAFKLKIKEDYLNFQGEADVLIRIRESGKNNYLEFKDKINIIKPEDLPKNSATQEGLAAISQQSLKMPNSWKVFFIASTIAVFSGLIILILKKKMIK